jgi:hypothetical protein
VLNASGNLTNAATTAAELDFVNGVTSAIQTQLNGKQNGQTNANQFGASTTLTIASGALTTNAQVRGLTPLGLTASRAAFIDASGNLTNVTSGSPSTEYVKADGTTGTPSGSGSTNTPVIGVGDIFLTNQIAYFRDDYNGSNGVTAVAVTNNWDLRIGTFHSITNPIGTNWTAQLSNITQSASFFTGFRGIGTTAAGYSNQFSIRATAGVNIKWMNWQTNGNYDVLVRPGYTYHLSGLATEATNVNVFVGTDDPNVAPITLLSTINLTFSNAVGTNIQLSRSLSTSNIITSNLQVSASIWSSNLVASNIQASGAITSSNLISSNAYISRSLNVSNVLATNMAVRGGSGASNAWVGGLVFYSASPIANPTSNGTPAFVISNAVSAHTLTNNGDTIRAQWFGRMPAALESTNQFQIVFGSQTILDTGLQTASNTAWQVELVMTRTGNTAQHCDAWLRWGPGGGVPFAFTNVSVELVQTNGIQTGLYLLSTSTRQGGHTNTACRVYYEPAPR